MNAQRRLHYSNVKGNEALLNAFFNSGSDAADRLDKAFKEIKDNKEKYTEAQRKTYDLISEMDRQGFKYETVRVGRFEKSQGYERQINSAKVKIKELRPDEIGNVTSTYDLISGKVVDPREKRYKTGEQYKIDSEKKRLEEKARNEEAYARAKNNNSYELDFLEAIQNKNYFDNNKNRKLAEYKEYLQDRDRYWENGTDRGAKDNVETGRKLHSLSESQRKQAELQARKQSVQNYTRVKSMRSSGMTYAQIAKKLGISESTVWAMIFDEE